MFSNWYAVCVSIKKPGDSAIYRFPINTWVSGTMDFSVGTGLSYYRVVITKHIKEAFCFSQSDD